MEEYSEKQLAILKVAERLFADQGFHGTSVRDIAQEADVNIAMISYYFGSKDKLLETIFRYRMEASRKFINELLENNTLEPLEKINSLIDRFINKMLGEQYFQCIMSREQLNSQASPVRDLIWELKGEMLGLMQPIVTQAQEAGIFYKDVDVEMLMTTLFGTIHQVIPAQHILKKSAPATVTNDDEFREYVKTRVSTHLKKLFKAILTHEF
ncbi:TetR family transcriptional regulator [Chitinophaga polysaccharea]|uniref:TetR family transcriptional regulator n=1 Tax=Chitinophaga polysaccharea TaxID=1293035 RepID=A0A561PNQ5_9BACT|nr:MULTISPECIES: TetR family transcriptional regulator [Chitinophaga]NLR59051.1 TetR/AcrR family transcriptional regulator [Chitinophaga polysaccharea]NLU92178.1 TetR/AcrR family transcriptional regulator [Chitinophaga sp. Ak27]TWF39751.1 TetR family transcriptional regulator [Chitinophaga polysaccharea]